MSNARILFVTVVCLALVGLSCTSGPPPVVKGSPEWYWQAANETWAEGDLVKTSNHLEPLLKPGNPFEARAQPWLMVITGGMARGFGDIADAYELGAKSGRVVPLEFRREASRHRERAGKLALQFAEAFMATSRSKVEGPVPLAFSYPKGSPLPVPELAKTGEGQKLKDEDMSVAIRRAVERRVLLMAVAAAGAGEDAAKAQQVFTGPDATVPREVFLQAMAEKLLDIGELFGERKLDQPDRVKLIAGEALSVLKALPESDGAKKLIKRAEDTLKKIR